MSALIERTPPQTTRRMNFATRALLCSLFTLALCWGLLAPRTLPGQLPPDEESRLAEARAALTAGALDRVLAILDRTPTDTPESFVPLILEACRRSQRFEQGRKWVEAYSERPELSTPMVLAIAQWEAEEGWVRRAGARLDRALEHRPTDSALWAGRARLARSEGDAESAWSAAARAIEHGIDPQELAWLRGEAAIELGREQEAVAILTELLAVSEGHVGARLTLARLVRGQGDSPRAIALLWRSLELSPDHSAALGELGSLLVRTAERNETGARLLERFRKIRDRRERIERLIRERREGRDSLILRAELARLLRLDDKPAVAFSIASVPLPGGDVSESEKPVRSTLHFEAGLALRALGQDRGALGSFSRALLADPSNDRIRLELADTLLALGDARRSIVVLDRMGDGSDPIARETILIHALARVGRPWEEIGSRLFALVRAKTSDVEIARSFVDAAIGYDVAPVALKSIEEWLAVDPGAPLAQLTLAWLLSETLPEDPRLPLLESWWEARAAHSPLGVEAWLWLAARRTARDDATGAEEALRGAKRARAVFGPRRAGVHSDTNDRRLGH